MSAQETGRAWVAAANERDWQRLCELSASGDRAACERDAADAFRDELRLIEVSDAELVVADGSTSVGADGWTAYGPRVFPIVEYDGEPRVHFEITVIR